MTDSERLLRHTLTLYSSFIKLISNYTEFFGTSSEENEFFTILFNSIKQSVQDEKIRIRNCIPENDETIKRIVNMFIGDEDEQGNNNVSSRI